MIQLNRCSPDEVARLLSKMCLQTKVVRDNQLQVEIPPTRHDVIHACDIYEDIAIAWGYNNIARTIPKTATIGREVSLSICFSVDFIFFLFEFVVSSYH